MLKWRKYIKKTYFFIFFVFLYFWIFWKYIKNMGQKLGSNTLHRVGYTYCPIMIISQQSPPLIFIWTIVLLLLQHNLASCSSSKLTIPRASVAKFTGTRQTFQSLELPKHPFAHSKGSLQPDGLSHLIWKVLTLISGTQHFPSSVSTMLGLEWFIKPVCVDLASKNCYGWRLHKEICWPWGFNHKNIFQISLCSWSTPARHPVYMNFQVKLLNLTMQPFITMPL